MKKEKVARIVVSVIVAVVIAAVAFLGGFLTCKFTRKRELSSFEWALDTIKKYYYEDISDEELLVASMRGISALELDRYSGYYTQKEYEELYASNSGSRSGVGISYTYIEDKYAQYHPDKRGGVFINMVVGNSPAFESGLRAGEFIDSVKVGEKSYSFESSDEFSAVLDSIADGVEFSLVSNHGEYAVSKQDYTMSYAVMYTNTTEYSIIYDSNNRGFVEENEKKGISYLPQGAAYMRLDQFFGNAANEMAGLMGIFNEEHCTSLILDLRGNGGGYVDLMCDISDIFTGQLPHHNDVAMRAVYKDGTIEKAFVSNIYSSSQMLPADTKVSVLADHNTASASEALIGVLIDNGVIDYKDIYISDFEDGYAAYLRGINDAPEMDILNCRTYGKGIMQTTFQNPVTHEALKLTTAKLYWPKGETCIHGTGLNKGMGCNTLKTDWDVTYGDVQLSEAVKVIYGE